LKREEEEGGMMAWWVREPAKEGWRRLVLHERGDMGGGG